MLSPEAILRREKEGRLHIGYFQSGYPIPSGPTTAVQGLSLALTRLGHKVTIYGCERRENTEELPSNSGLREALFPTDSINRFHVSRALLRRLEQNEDELDFLIINLMFNPPNLVVARAARTRGIPYIISPHDPYHPELLKKNRLLKTVYGALFEKSLLRHAAAVQVLAPEHARFLPELGFAGNVLVIPNGFGPSSVPSFGGEVCSTVGPSGIPRFLSLGRLDMHHKGLDLLIEGFAKALRSGAVPQGTELTLAGPDGGDLQKLRRRASLHHVADRTVFTGRVSDQTRGDLLRNCDVVLLCSRYDGFGLAALEGMLAGKPLMVSREAGISAWIRQAGCGVLVEPSVNSICSGFIELIELREKWQAMGERGRSYACQNMTWDRIGRHAAECYRNLLIALKNRPQVRDIELNIIGADIESR